MNVIKSRSLSFALLFFCCLFAGNAAAENRTIDGSNNNSAQTDWGAAHIQLMRGSSGAHYSDGISSPGGASRANAREISNKLFAQNAPAYNSLGLSDFVWQWGQFIDHDIDLTDAHKPVESFNINVPAGDPYFDPFNTGSQIIGLNRSAYDTSTGTSTSNPRQQINEITAWLDGSVVYGSDTTRSEWLRTKSDGLLKTTASIHGDLMPLNDGTQPNAMGPSTDMFVGGDVRANEQVGLTSMHTLFVREHNLIAGELKILNPLMSDEELYQAARARVGAEIQAITYNEFLPAVLGDNALTPYSGYDASVNPGIANAFSTAAYRVGHTMIPEFLQRLDNDNNPAAGGLLALRDGFFNPDRIKTDGIEVYLQGLAYGLMQDVDVKVNDSLRNFLFGPPGAGGLDLVSLNIQRGRDHGLPDYNTLRQEYGLTAVSAFHEITSDPDIAALLEMIYGDVSNIDPWVGGLAEDHKNNSILGELFHSIWVDQFTRLRDGDRFWYFNHPGLSQNFKDSLETLRLSDIIMRNTGITNIQDNVFYASHDYTTAVPEPSTFILFLLGGFIFLAKRFYSRQKTA